MFSTRQLLTATSVVAFTLGTASAQEGSQQRPDQNTQKTQQQGPSSDLNSSPGADDFNNNTNQSASDRTNQARSSQTTSQQQGMQENAPQDYVLVRRVYLYDLAEEPGKAMDQAQQQIQRNQPQEAAESLQRAAAFLRIEAATAQSDRSHQALQRSADRLEQSAEQLRNGQGDPRQAMQSMSQASRDLSDARFERGRQSWSQNSRQSQTGNRTQSDSNQNWTQQDFTSAADYRQRSGTYSTAAGGQANEQDRTYNQEIRDLADRSSNASDDRFGRDVEAFNTRYYGDTAAYGAYGGTQETQVRTSDDNTTDPGDANNRAANRRGMASDSARQGMQSREMSEERADQNNSSNDRSTNDRANRSDEKQKDGDTNFYKSDEN